MTDGRPTRRGLLGAWAGSALAALAGCNRQAASDTTTNDTPTPTPTTSEESTPTVVFTDTPTAGDTATPADTPTTTSTPPPEDVVFDGGDLRSFVDAVYAADNVESGLLQVEPGTYRFAPLDAANMPDSYHAAMANLADVTVEGNGATFLFTDPLRGGLRFVNSETLTLRNLTVDFDPVPFTQGDLVEVSADRERMRVALDADYPSLNHGMFAEAADVWASVHDPDGSFVDGLKTTGTPRKLFSDIRPVDDRTFELTLQRGVSTAGLREGNRLTIVARNHETAVTFGAVDAPTVRNVTVHASGGSAFSFAQCDSPRVVDSYMGPPPDSSRQVGTDGDGVRLVNVAGTPRVENCRADSLLDDNVVVQQVLGRVDGLPAADTVEVVDPLIFMVDAGDRLEAMAPDGTLRDELPSVTGVSESSSDEGRTLRIQFAASVAETLSADDLLRNAANAPEQFTVRGNELRNNRGIQIRVAASNGVVEDNTLVGASRNAVELEVDTDGIFVPKGWVTDVAVRDNTIRDVGMKYFAGDHPSGVRVHHLPRPEVPTNGHPIRNITIAGNTIEHTAGSGIELEAASGVEVADNTIRDVNNLEYPPGDYGLLFYDAEDVAVTGNTVSGPGERLAAFGWQRGSSGIDLSENELIIDGSSAAVSIEDG